MATPTRMMSAADYNPQILAFISSTDEALGLIAKQRETLGGANILASLISDLYPYDLNNVERVVNARAHRWLRRANWVDRHLHANQVSRFGASVRVLRHFFPPTFMRVHEIAGLADPAVIAHRNLQSTLGQVFHVTPAADREDPQEWFSLGTLAALSDLFEMAYMFKRDANTMGSETWVHPNMTADSDFDAALAEFVRRLRGLLRNP